MNQSSRDQLESFLQGLEREPYTGEAILLLHFHRGELTKVRPLKEDKKH